MAGRLERNRDGRSHGEADGVRLRAHCIPLCILFPAVLFSSTWAWKSYTSMFEITGLSEAGNRLWCGSTGGLLTFDPLTAVFATKSNTEGLASNAITTVASDDSGRIWIGFVTGTVQRYDPNADTWLTIDDYEGQTVTCFELAGDSLFIGLDIGLSLYLVSRQEVKETYRRLGPRLQIEIPVRDIGIDQEEIWVVTGEGIARAKITSTNLLDPAAWTNHSQLEGVPSDDVTSIEIIDGHVYAGTTNGAAEWDGSVWTVLSEESVFDMTVHEGALAVSMGTGVHIYQDGQWQNKGSGPRMIRVLISFAGTLWGGTDQGIWRYSGEDAAWESFLPETVGSNLISSLAVDHTDELWCCSRDKGFFRYNGDSWAAYDLSGYSILRTNDFVSIAVDHDNNRWIGSWGGGLIRVGADDGLSIFDSQDGILHGIPENPDYVVVPDIAVGQEGTVWLLNYYAASNQGLVSMTSDAQPTYYGINEGISTTLHRIIEIAEDGRIWVGTESQGIFILNDNGTPSMKEDDDPVIRLTTSQGLDSNTITALAKDTENGMWIGTPEGLHYYFAGSVTRRFGLPSDNITALIVDGSGNVWAGTDAGIAYFSDVTFSWTHFTVENSHLVSNDVSTLFFDNSTGEIYIGTSQGYSVLATPYSEPLDDLQQLVVYPNPFNPKEHLRLTIDNLAKNISLLIYTPSGHLVKQFGKSEISGRSVQWDGTDDRGQGVPSGIYLVLAIVEGGEKRMGKFALVR